MSAGLDYLLSVRRALDHPVTVTVVAIVGAMLVLTPLATVALSKLGMMGEKTAADVWKRYWTWLFLAPAMLVPIVVCPLGAMVLVCVASLLCYREFARATGLFRFRVLSAIVVVGIVAINLAAVDHWFGLFITLTPVTALALVVAGILPDEPKGYIQRVALAVAALLLFGSGLGRLSYMANDAGYRPLVCGLIMCTQLSDILAYVCGKTFGKRKLFPNTSPNKTLGGHLGAFLLIAPLAAVMAHYIFPGTALDRWPLLAGFGVIVAAGAQLGDLMIGSIKRDVGIKDMAATLPGHGGFLDRFNSVLLVAPAIFHYVNFFVPFGADRAARVFTGVW